MPRTIAACLLGLLLASAARAITIGVYQPSTSGIIRSRRINAGVSCSSASNNLAPFSTARIA